MNVLESWNVSKKRFSFWNVLKTFLKSFFVESTQLCELRRFRMVLRWFVNIFVETIESRVFSTIIRVPAERVIFLVRILGVVLRELFSDPGTYPG